MRTALLALSLSIWPCAASAPPQAMRGVWVTSTDSRVLDAPSGIREAVDRCAALGLDTLYVVTWNQGRTTYPSRVVEALTGEAIDPRYRGRDPLREVVEAAHGRGLRVIAWFEYGFAAAHQPEGGALLRARPGWAALDRQDRPVVKNGFAWMNGFLPEVQDFMVDLVMEVVRAYGIDGIQGDDRLPAMPSESGYDPTTVARYRSEHGGSAPPQDPKDAAWIQWRADRMTDFLARLHRTVKAHRPDLLVSMAPSPYPWSKTEYLQDWPVWLRKGLVDQLHPQLYHRDPVRYEAALGAQLREVPVGQRSRCSPGILLKLGDYAPSEAFLAGVLRAHRVHGIAGASFFHYEGLQRHAAFLRSFLAPVPPQGK